MNMKIDVYNVSFNSEGAIMDCRVMTKCINANMQIMTNIDETQKALQEGTTVQLAYKYIAEMGNESAEHSIDDMEKLECEIEQIKEQNKVLSEAIAEIGEMLVVEVE